MEEILPRAKEHGARQELEEARKVQASQGTDPANTLISDVRLYNGEETHFCCWKLPFLWSFVMVVLAN